MSPPCDVHSADMTEQLIKKKNCVGTQVEAKEGQQVLTDCKQLKQASRIFEWWMVLSPVSVDVSQT